MYYYGNSGYYGPNYGGAPVYAGTTCGYGGGYGYGGAIWIVLFILLVIIIGAGWSNCGGNNSNC